MVFALTFVVSSIVRHVGTERRQRWVKQAFSRYVSPNLVEHLVSHPDALKLSGVRQQCSFLFTDLEGFTTLMETTDPAAAVSLVNRYLDGMIAIAFAHDGTLTRIVGDGLAILFSAPIVQEDHPIRALRCALAMQKFAHQYAGELQARGIAFGQTRMGVHSGEVIVGNFGGSTILDYRALGDPINTASRLEGANRYLGTLVCVSQAVLAQCPSFAARPIGRLLLKGKQQPIMVFEPLDMTTTPDADYRQAFECMRSQTPDALAAFERLAQERPLDRLVAMHLARLRRGEVGDLLVMEGK
jgi:adenylate cyclase